MAIYNILFDVAARTAKFEQAMTRVERRFDGLQRTAAKVTRAVAGVFGGAALGRTFFNWTKQAIDNADALGTLAESFGTTAAAISRLDYVAKQNNTSVEQLTSGLTALQKNLILAREDSGGARKALEELKVRADDLTKLPLPRQLEDIADAFVKIKNPADRVRIAAQLFGDEVGRKMIPILARGADGIRALNDESDRLGNTLTEEVLAKLQATDAEFKRLEATSMALKRELAVGLGPAIVEIGEVLVTTAKGARGFAEGLASIFHGADEPVARLQERLEDLAERRNAVLSQLRRAETHGDSEIADRLRPELAKIEADMNRVNSAIQQFGRDAEAAFGNATAAAKTTAAGIGSAESQLRRLIGAIRQDFPTTIRLQNELLAKPLGSLEENEAALRSYFQGITRENVALRERTIQINDQISVDAEKTSKEVAEHWLEAQRGIQRSFADLYRSIGEGGGLRGFLTSIGETIKSTLANDLAAATMDLLGIGEKSKGGLLSKIFGGGRGGGGGEAASVAAAGVAADPCACFHGVADGLASKLGDSLARVGEKVASGATLVANQSVTNANYLADTIWAVRKADQKASFIEGLIGALAGGFGGGFAKGGHLAPGKWGLVGELGPELAFGGAAGKTIVPMTSSAAASPTYAPVYHFHIDARSDRAAVRQDMMAIASEVTRSGFERYRDYISRGGR